MAPSRSYSRCGGQVGDEEEVEVTGSNSIAHDRCPGDAREAVWLAVYPSGGIAGTSLDRAVVVEQAAAVGGVLVAVPIVEDYRS